MCHFTFSKKWFHVLLFNSRPLEGDVTHLLRFLSAVDWNQVTEPASPAEWSHILVLTSDVITTNCCIVCVCGRGLMCICVTERITDVWKWNLYIRFYPPMIPPPPWYPPSFFFTSPWTYVYIYNYCIFSHQHQVKSQGSPTLLATDSVVVETFQSFC